MACLPIYKTYIHTYCDYVYPGITILSLVLIGCCLSELCAHQRLLHTVCLKLLFVLQELQTTIFTIQHAYSVVVIDFYRSVH